MDQKNTIVKCKAHPNCLFNYDGVCDNYVINIGADGKCECYVETGLVGNAIQDPVKIGLALKEISKQMDIQRGQRAEGNFYDDACDISFLREDLEKIQKTLERESIPCTMKIAEFNKPNKNRSVISDWDYAATLDICKTCKKVIYGQPCQYKNVANGVWACYERDESIKKAGALDICWWCDFFNSEKRSCTHKNPDIDKLGCHSLQSTGGNR